jgi:hypothetical protein
MMNSFHTLLQFQLAPLHTGRLRNAGIISERAEPALIIVDKARSTPSPAAYFLASKKSSLVLSGSKEAEIFDIYPGRECMDMEKKGGVNVIGKVVLAVRAPGGGNDGMTTDFVG